MERTLVDLAPLIETGAPMTNEQPIAHDPGPWAVIDGQIVSLPIDEVVPVLPVNEGEPPRDHHRGLVALVYGHHNADNQYSLEANRHLIAAAPELLAALKELTAGLWAGEGTSFPRIRGEEVAKARAAIAKAAGR